MEQMMEKEKQSFCWLKDISLSDTPLVGGKASSLGELYNQLTPKGIRVSNAYVITTNVYRQYIEYNDLMPQINTILDKTDHTDLVNLKRSGLAIRELILNGKFSEELEEMITEHYITLSNQYLDTEGNPQTSTDVAVRSSSVAEDTTDCSFAGIYDTFLNVRGQSQLLSSIKACYASLYNNRAIAYRKETNRKFDDISIAVIIHKMVRSDIASSGVVFTADVENGYDNVIIINSSYGLCELVVQGEAIVPDEFVINKKKFAEGFPSIIDKKLGKKTEKMIYSDNPTEKVRTVGVSKRKQNSFSLRDEEVLKLAHWSLIIEEHYQDFYGQGQHYDMEFAKDGLTGELYLVQTRPLTTFKKPSSEYTEFAFDTEERPTPILEGIAVGSSIATGKVRIILSLDDRGDNDDIIFNEGDILVTSYTSPDWEPLMKKASAILTDFGGRTSHASIICREWGKCCIVALSNVTTTLVNNQTVTASCTEGEIGYVYEGEIPFTIHKTDLSQFSLPSTTKLMLNLASPDMAFKYHHLPTQGIGLLRIEFIISNYIKCHPMALVNYSNLKLTEPELYEEITELSAGYETPTDYYVSKFAQGIAKIATSVYPHPCIVRTSDFKSNEYSQLLGGHLYEPKEENPMIGFRGASRYYSKLFQSAFELECQAILKARETLGLDNIHVMIPFCRTVPELEKVLSIMKSQGLDRDNSQTLKIGIMCEIPSNVILAKQFAQHSDFFSIGSNDLTQLTLGLDRDGELVSHLFDERNQAVKSLISSVIESCHQGNKPIKIGICGDAPSSFPDFAKFLIDEGIDSISLTPDAILKCLKYFASISSLS
jgi:pyruvate, water dikinase